MKTKIKKNIAKYFVCYALVLITLGLCFFMFQTTPTFADEIFREHKISQGNFSMTMTIDSRRNNTLPLDQRVVETDSGDITYLCFKWRDIKSLHFRFSADLSEATNIYTGYEFLVTTNQTEDLNSSFGMANPKTLYQGLILNNTFSQFDFNYYIDKDTDISESATRCRGNDFGLYKFDFNYTYVVDDIERKISIGEIYVAILPDEVENINSDNLQILYSVSSSNKLMNIFNLYLSTDAYKFVNPEHLEWSVIGKDTTNINYVLSQKFKDENPRYANYRVIWQSQEKEQPIGTSFIFDSNDIEGTWNVFLTIKNKDGSTKQTLNVANLSTIKQEHKSFLWLILLIAGCLIAIAVVITLIIFKKKRDKVW